MVDGDRVTRHRAEIMPPHPGTFNPVVVVEPRNVVVAPTPHQTPAGHCVVAQGVLVDNRLTRIAHGILDRQLPGRFRPTVDVSMRSPAAIRSRLMRRRVLPDVPPHTPTTSWSFRAYSRHSSQTGHLLHISYGVFRRTPRAGKKSSVFPLQAPCAIQSGWKSVLGLKIHTPIRGLRLPGRSYSHKWDT